MLFDLFVLFDLGILPVLPDLNQRNPDGHRMSKVGLYPSPPLGDLVGLM